LRGLAREWLVDNIYLIKEQVRTVRRHFPPGYSRTLPRVQGGASPGMPRVYDLTLELISHGDGHVYRDSLVGIVSAYQNITPLILGEL
jgi:cyclic beta-1,2-glucan synthetase